MCFQRSHSILFLLFICSFFPLATTLYSAGLDSLKKIVDTLPVEEKAAVYNRMFVMSGTYQLSDTALIYAQNALRYAHETKDTFQTAFANRNIGFYYNSIHENKKAVEYYVSALDLLKKGNDLRRTYVIYDELADILISSRSYDQASELLYEALKYSEEKQYINGKIGVHRNLGALYRQLNEYEKASQHLKDALEILESQDKINPREHSTMYRTLGLIHFDKKEFDTALEFLHKSLEIQQNESDPRILMMIHNSIALVYTNQNKSELALQHYHKALRFAEISNNQNLITAAKLNIGHHYSLLGNPKRAELELTAGLVLADKFGFTKWQRNAHDYLYKNYIQLGDYKKAVQHIQDYHFYDDSLKIEENKLKIAELETKYETEKKEQQINLLNKENEIKTLKLRQNRNLLGAALLILIIIILSTLNYFRLMRQKQKSREIIEKQEFEKELLSTVISTEDKERKRFAADLHDGLGPLLSSVKLYISGIEDADEEDKKEMMKYTRELVDQSISSVRTISNNILPLELSENGLISSIRSFCNKISYSQKITIGLKDNTGGFRLEPSNEIILYRVIQELINNTIKHARATLINILFKYENSEFIIEYADNGKGFDYDNIVKEERSGLGLDNINERVKSLGGIVKFNSKTGEGIEVMINLGT